MIRRVLFLGALLSGLVTGLSASALSGTFNMSGDITVTSTTISWTSDMAPHTPEMFTLSVGAGSFSTEDGQNGVSDLDISTAPVGTVFVDTTPFITFDVAPAPSLMLNFISAGFGGSAGCTQPAVNPPPTQTCTPPNPGGSPFTFTNQQAGQSAATFVFSGVTSDGLSDWVATFSSNFNAPFQTELATLAASGSLTNSYNAAVTVTPIPPVNTPEPTSAFMLACGLGLLAVSFGTKRLAKNQTR
jgi:hypothetical protein